MIDLEKLNFEHREAINELRKRVEDTDPDYLQEDPSIFYRFLKARDFDVERAEKMLRKHINWRKAHQIPLILREFKVKEFFKKYIEPSSLGFDKEGDFVSYAAMGKMEAKEILKCATMNEYMKHWIWFAEKNKAVASHVRKQEEKALTPQISFIVDLDELTLANTTNKQCAEACLRLMHILQDNYPEALKSVYIINAPGYSVVIFSILKAIMSHAMNRKFHFYGQNGWKEKLLEHIDADVLPAFLGGTRTDPDGNPLCKTFVSHAGTIPPCHFLSVEDRYFKDKTPITNISVPKSDEKKIDFNVKEEGSVIQWEFLVKNKDIGFGLFFQNKDELLEILPITRFDTIDGTEMGSYRAKFPGKYVIVFDNSYSWMSSKEIQYCVKVIKQDL